MLLGGWSITPVITFQSGFPMGVSQNVDDLEHVPDRRHAAAEHRAGRGFPGARATSPTRIKANVTDNLYYNKAAFSTSPTNTFGNAPRMLPGVLSPWRNNVDLSISKNFRTGGETNRCPSVPKC